MKKITNYIEARTVSIKNHPELSEEWIKQLIIQNPSILGLGTLEVGDVERQQSSGGRLDLLLKDLEANRRYEVEIQLGKTDETHIIRTIEYWDLERKRYPHIDHCAVIIAEEITSRFFNVISLFNQHIPIIAIKMTAVEVGSNFTVTFTKVLDEVDFAYEEEDSTERIDTDRKFWTAKSSEALMNGVDTIFKLTSDFAVGYELSYKRHFIGTKISGRPHNFIHLVPQRGQLKVCLKMPRSTEIDDLLSKSNLPEFNYNPHYKRYEIGFGETDLKNDTLLGEIKEFMRLSFNR
ncbi:hypothetical protein [Bdellovibrio bacteriovorus]|uniref:hypothetical protein n=1 Tax=Bdellovibrio bacteriovorus TaxID=959 RepID=UPI003D092F68